MGIPKTIDNDLYGTDHCPGYASAAKYIATSVMEVYRDSTVYDTGMIHRRRVHGPPRRLADRRRRARQLLRRGADLIYLPEVDFDLDAFTEKVKAIYEKNKKCLVVVSEGIHDKDGKFISEYGLRGRGEDALRSHPARRSRGVPRQPHEGGDRREGARHRAEPAAALRGALRLSDRPRRVLLGGQGRCGQRRRRRHRQDGRLRARLRGRQVRLQDQALRADRRRQYREEGAGRVDQARWRGV